MTKSRPISPRRWSTPGQLDADRHGPNLVRELPFSSLTTTGALAPSATPSSTLLPFVLFLRLYRGNKDGQNLPLLAISLQDTSDAIGVTEARQSWTRLRDGIRAWTEAETKAGGAGSMDGIIAAYMQLKKRLHNSQVMANKIRREGNIPDD